MHAPGSCSAPSPSTSLHRAWISSYEKPRPTLTTRGQYLQKNLTFCHDINISAFFENYLQASGLEIMKDSFLFVRSRRGPRKEFLAFLTKYGPCLKGCSVSQFILRRSPNRVSPNILIRSEVKSLLLSQDDNGK